MHAGLFLCGNKTLLYSVFIIPEKPWVEWIIPYFTYIYKQDVPKVLKHHFLLLAHSELFLCTVLDTSIEKGVWENKQKTSHGITQHEKVKKIVFEAFICSHHNRSVNLILWLLLNGVRTSWSRHYSCKHLHDDQENVGVKFEFKWMSVHFT